MEIQLHPKNADTPVPAPEHVPFRDIVYVRLRYFPTRAQTNRYECILQTRTGRSWKVVNQFYEGPMTFRDESTAYSAFIRELVQRVAIANPSAAFVRGTAAASYYLSLGFCILMFVLLAAVILTIGFTFHWLVLVKLVIIAAFIPVLVRYARRSKPGPLDPHRVPADTLPS